MGSAGVSLSWQVAQVLAMDGHRLRLRFARPEFCKRCQRGDGCGAGIFSGLFPRRETEIEIESDQTLNPGNWVRVGLPHRDLALGAVRVYGLPLLAFVAGAVPAHWLVGPDGWRDLAALASGLTAGILAFLLARQVPGLRMNPVIEPLSCDQGDTRSIIGND